MSLRLAVLVGIIVNCIWGTAFLIPYWLSDINPVAIAIGRYAAYGAVSLVLISIKKKGRQQLNWSHWKMAALLALLGNIGYYALLSSAINLSGITTVALITGILPVTLSIAGNFVEKRFPFSSLLLPLGLIMVGICWNNIDKIGNSEPQELSLVIYGIVLAILALAIWTLYGVLNSQFLKKHAQISSSLWSEAIGVACLVQAGLFYLVLIAFQPNTFDSIFNSSNAIWFLLGSLFLGVVVSWLATIGWNKASINLPIAVVGQLIVFETIASLAYGYILDARLPSFTEFACAILIISGVYIGIRRASIAEGNRSSEFETSASPAS